MNNGYIYRERIGERAVGKLLGAYLSARYTHSSPEEWAAYIQAGRVTLDGVVAGEAEVLCTGQRLEWHRPAWEEPAADLAFKILYDQGGVLVVAKPAGLPTLAGGGFLENTLVHQLRLAYGQVSPMHRLGRWTSGAVVCSRTKAVGASIAAQFKGRSVDKRYRALVSGRPVQDVFQVDVPIGPVDYAPLGTLHAASPLGREASSRATVLERRDATSLCDVVISTGRPHQIRVHMAAAGHPLWGDPLYGIGGLPLPGGTAVPGDEGYHLHSAEISFVHPELNERVTVLAPPPPLLRLQR